MVFAEKSRLTELASSQEFSIEATTAWQIKVEENALSRRLSVCRHLKTDTNLHFIFLVDLPSGTGFVINVSVFDVDYLLLKNKQTNKQYGEISNTMFSRVVTTVDEVQCHLNVRQHLSTDRYGDHYDIM